MTGDHFGDGSFADDVDEALRIVVDLAEIEIDATAIARELPALIARARNWRAKHVSTVD